MTRFKVSFDGIMDYVEELERENHQLKAKIAKTNIQAVRRFITAYPHASDDEIMAVTGLTKIQVVDCQKAIVDGYVIAGF